MGLRIVPLGLEEANDFVIDKHRHHRDVYRLNHIFSFGCADDSGALRGVAICGRPVAMWADRKERLEVLRVCTDGHRNACSILYAAAARAAGWSEAHRTGAKGWASDRRPRQENTELFPRIYWQRRLR